MTAVALISFFLGAAFGLLVAAVQNMDGRREK